ncbi:MAG: hypothetical protein IPP66_15250 [Anaerolineales bacterium]|nr:hypothetical protein [Anaerolineales bacterium]
MEYKKAEPVKLRDVGKDERWLQDRINDDPSILGLGDLVVIQRERPQNMGGRLDFLMYDPEDTTRYEIEIMLGTLNESHIIRTIEYWDIERRRYPALDHRAVIVAEEITNRFFNVISLMNKAIPIIAIQLNAFRVENNLYLNFVKVLDLADSGEEDETGAEDVADRKYWDARANPQSMALVDAVIEILSSIAQPRLTYNKGHIAVGTSGRNFMWCHPRKGQHLLLALRVEDERDNLITKFEEHGVESRKGSRPYMARIIFTMKELEENKELITDVIRIAESHSH